MIRFTHIRHVLLMLSLILSVGLNAQIGLQSAEYYIDTDPGQGVATPLTVSDGTIDEAVEQMQATLASLSAGMHEIGIRYRDSLGTWSAHFRTVISVENALTARDFHLTMAEYYLDTCLLYTSPSPRDS